PTIVQADEDIEVEWTLDESVITAEADRIAAINDLNQLRTEHTAALQSLHQFQHAVEQWVVKAAALQGQLDAYQHGYAQYQQQAEGAYAHLRREYDQLQLINVQLQARIQETEYQLAQVTQQGGSAEGLAEANAATARCLQEGLNHSEQQLTQLRREAIQFERDT